MQKLTRVALLISGGGSTMFEIARSSMRLGTSPLLSGLIDVACVISSNADAPGIEKARGLGIRTEVIDPKQLGDKFGTILLQTLARHKVEAFGQHGWMAITPPEVVKEFEGRAINQHPGPLDPQGYERLKNLDFGGINPGMYGRRVHCARLYFCRQARIDYWTEATAHLVAPEVDGGLLIHTQQVPIQPDDTVETLAARVLPVEHQVQIEAWRQLATGTIVPHRREKRLLMLYHDPVLVESKKVARTLYPNG